MMSCNDKSKESCAHCKLFIDRWSTPIQIGGYCKRCKEPFTFYRRKQQKKQLERYYVHTIELVKVIDFNEHVCKIEFPSGEIRKNVSWKLLCLDENEARIMNSHYK
jgi:hypothetical protein